MGCAYRRGHVWWLKYQDAAGEPRYEATPARSATEAKALLREIEERVFRQRRGLEPATLNPENWTVGDLMRWWLDQYSSRSSRTAATRGRFAPRSSPRLSPRSASST